MSSQGLNSLATIIKRLEAATSRLEDIAVVQSGGVASFADSNATRPVSAILASSASSAAPPAPQHQQPPQPGFGNLSSDAAPDSVPASVSAFDERIIDGKLKVFVEQSNGLTQQLLVQQANLVANMFANTRAVLLCASACMKPSTAEFAAMVKPIHADFDAIEKIKETRDKALRDWVLHLQTVSEGAGCVRWIHATGNAANAVKEAKESAEFYSNKVIKEHKEKDKKHVDWARSYISLIDELAKYVTEYHKMGLTWNPKGGKAVDFTLATAAGTSSTPTITIAGPPPPPPPPPPPVVAASTSSGEMTGAAAVFAQINQGADVTKGLKKVDKSEMTHKNPSLRVSGAVPARSPSSSPTSKQPPKPKKPASLQAKKPPKLELQGSKWVIEYQENERELVLEDVSINQVVTLYGCKNTTLQIKGKINGVSMTNCQKTSLVVDSAISVISITNCQSFQLQVLGSAPTIQIETTDSGQVYLSEACLGAEIVTAKCSAINISIPVGDEGDFQEKPVPEMLRTVIQDGKLVTSIVEHTG